MNFSVVTTVQAIDSAELKTSSSTNCYATTPNALNNVQANNNSILLHPNPSNGVFAIANNSVTKVNIYNLFGSKIFTTQHNNIVDISLSPKGIYLVEIFTKDARLLHKIVLD